MAATTTSSDWASYYRATIVVTGGGIEALYALEDNELAVISKGQLDLDPADASTEQEGGSRSS